MLGEGSSILFHLHFVFFLYGLKNIFRCLFYELFCAGPFFFFFFLKMNVFCAALNHYFLDSIDIRYHRRGYNIRHFMNFLKEKKERKRKWDS